MRRAHPAASATPLPRRLAPFLLICLAALAAPPAVAEATGVPDTRPEAAAAPPARNLSGVAVEGADRVVVRLPAAHAEAEVDVQTPPGLVSYVNTGYSLRLGEGSTAGEGTAVVEVELGPLESAAPFQLPPLEDAAEASEVERLAREITARSATLYGAVSSVLGWVVHNVVTDETAALVPTPAAGGGEGAPRSQEPEAVIARGSGDTGGIARLTVALLRAVGIEARTVRGRVVGSPEAAGPWGPHTWVEVRYPDAGWVFSDPLHHHHYVPATYLRLAPTEVQPQREGAEVTPAAPAAAPAVPDAAPEGEKVAAGDGESGEEEADRASLPTPAQAFELVERRDLRQTVDLYPLGGPGVTARRNRAVQRAGALRVVVSGPRRGSAVLEGADSRTSKILIDGESVFVGLATGSYRLEVYLEDEAPIVRQLDLGPRERRAIFLRRDADGGAEAAERQPGGAGGRDLPPPDHYRARQPTASRNSP